jgi:DNA-binding response OmpR family regulator
MAILRGRILCTEDDPDTRDLLNITLTSAGFQVVCTANAEDAINTIKGEKFDLCLMDNWMPGVSGEDLCVKIREFDTETPILFYSGAAYPADRERARAAGAQGYLVKPVLDDQLIAEVIRIIAESRIAVPVAVVPPDQCEPIKPLE